MTRASIVDEEFNTLYDEYVMPENPIMDYNTRYYIAHDLDRALT